MDLKEQAIQFFKSVLNHVDPEQFIPEIVEWDQNERVLSIYDEQFRLKVNQKMYVIGTGKASPSMAIAVEKVLGADLENGFIIAPPNTKRSPEKIEMTEGSHPLPDEKSELATRKLISLIKDISDDSIVINLLSGGTSALLCKPTEGLDINDFQTTYTMLLESGANIHQVNTVRKTLSDVKGGRLLHYFNRITLLDLIISDVPNDDLKSIGSGPTTPQEISYHQAFKLLKEYQLWNNLPHAVQDHLATNLEQEKKNDEPMQTPGLPNHHSWIVSSASKVARQAQGMLNHLEYETRLIEPAWSGLVEDFEDHIIQQLSQIPDDENKKRALIFFGESTVKVTGSGLGGRNQEIALRMAKRIKDYNRTIIFLSAGTDGIDGPTDVAGAVVDQNTYSKAVSDGIDPESYIQNNDSYHFFKKIGGHIKTGPTGNNVMDIQLLLIDPE